MERHYNVLVVNKYIEKIILGKEKFLSENK